jgi:hypothetical protein
MVFKASRTSISFCMHLSSMVSGHTGGAVVNCIVCTFVYVFLFVTPAWFGHYGFLEDEGLVRHAGEKQLRRWSNCKGTSVFCQEGFTERSVVFGEAESLPLFWSVRVFLHCFTVWLFLTIRADNSFD